MTMKLRDMAHLRMISASCRRCRHSAWNNYYSGSITWDASKSCTSQHLLHMMSVDRNPIQPSYPFSSKSENLGESQKWRSEAEIRSGAHLQDRITHLMAGRSESAMSVLSPLLFGHAAAMTLKAAVELKIPDILAQKPLSIHEIALELPGDAVDEQALHRVMRALAHLGVFEQRETHCYGLTPASRMLVRENNPGSLAPMVMYLNYEHSQTPWQHLHETILTGKNPFEAAHGKNSWEYSDVDAQYGELWNAMDRVQGGQKIEALKRYEGLRDVRTLVDVGGNKGATVAAIVAAHPHIRGINFDFPHVVAGAVDAVGVEHVAGNLLEDDVPCGDAMLLKNVVHLFNDGDALRVLQKCKKALPRDGKLLISDPVIPSELGEDSPYTRVPPMMDIGLLVYGGGVDRTEEQWRSLLAQAGFPNVRFICLQPQNWLIEASQ